MGKPSGSKQKRMPKIKDSKQSERFKKAARQLGAEEDSGALDWGCARTGKRESETKEEN